MAPRSKDGTRVVKLGFFAEREAARNEGTRCLLATGGREWLNLRGVFNACHLELARDLREEERPGVTLFVLGSDGIAGSLWLAADDQMRCGSVGRHGCADLFLPHEQGLSLRHCLVMVRRAGESLRVHVVDLSSSAGLRLEDDRAVSAIDADGHFFLRVPGAVLACFPTGGELPWNPESVPAWSSLAPRKLVKELEAEPERRHDAPHREATHVTVREAPIVEVSRDDALLLPDEVPAGRLHLGTEEREQCVEVGLSALDRGVVLGRYDRCVGSRALACGSVSRVHALLIRRGERLYLADAGSTNGVWLDDEQVSCAQVAPGTAYGLGSDAAIGWEPLD